MDFNRVNEALQKNSPVRRLRNRHIYSNITVTSTSSASITSSEKTIKTSSKTSSSLSSINSGKITAESSSGIDIDSLTNATSNISIHVNNCNDDESDDNVFGDELIEYESDTDEIEDDDEVGNDQITHETLKNKLTLVKTQRGRDKLCHSGFYYTVDKISADPPPFNKIFWKCERTGNKTIPKCPGRVYSINYYEPITVTVVHNHEPVPEKLNCLVAIDKIKQKALDSNENPRSIIRASQTNVDEEAAVIMVRQKNLTQMINRIRNSKIDHGQNPSCMEDVSESIAPSLKQTYRNEMFYLGECGTGQNKIFIFSTPNNMLLLNEINAWYVDGTFDVAPKLFKQLFTQHVILKCPSP